MMELPEEILKILEQLRLHHELFGDGLPMIASENVMSPLAEMMMISDLAHRYAEGLPGKRYYQGLVHYDVIEEMAFSLAREVFDAPYADVRPISGTVANMAVLMAYGRPGGRVIGVPTQAGGHISHAEFGAVGLRGMERFDLPVDQRTGLILVDEAARKIREVEPDLIILGRSAFLMPEPVRELSQVAEEVGAVLWYDAAHVLGLIGGGVFQHPLKEGARVVSASTHKTFPGPQHGIILANPADEEDEKRLRRAVFPGVVSNHHLMSVAALAVTLVEFKHFGREYASQIVRNARRLGEALYERGFRVLLPDMGFTRTHQLLVDMREFGNGRKAAVLLEKAGIIVNYNMLPWDPPNRPRSPSGIRIGVQELTRVGMRESEMEQVAEFFERVLKRGEDPARVKEDVREFKRDFRKVRYCFTPEDAYELRELVRIN